MSEKPIPENIRSVDENLFADVREVVTVEPNGKAKVCITITAHSRTAKTILLDEPYWIPVERASAVSARDLSRKKRLKARHDLKSKRILVEFSPDTELAPDEKFTWRVSFTVSQFWRSKLQTNQDQTVSTGIFSIATLPSYRGVPIQNHRMEIRFHFTRSSEGTMPIVEQSNNYQVWAERRTTTKGVQLIFDHLDLPKDADPMRITFTRSDRSCQVAGPPRRGSMWLDYMKPALTGLQKVVLAVVPTLIIEVIKRRLRL